MPALPSNGFLNTQPDLSKDFNLALYGAEVEMLLKQNDKKKNLRNRPLKTEW
jgi:hypothetical protein